jgi:5-methylcytosine-specific restriction protein A
MRMAGALHKLRSEVDREQVLRAVEEYDRLGPEGFFGAHGYGPSRSYELVVEGRRYPHKAVLGTAYELATGERLDPGDFEGGKAGAVAILEDLGFTVEPRA